MGKNQSASNLTNIIKQDANGGIAFMSGSTMLMALSNTGQMSGSVPAMSAVTASYADNFTVRGTLTAQTIVSQVVTSSTSLVTGSTIFGTSLANTHTFTGSMNLTGSLAVVTNGTEFQVNASGVNLGNALTDSHVISGSLRVNPNGLFVSSSGLVGIGLTNPSNKLEVQAGDIKINANVSSTANLYFGITGTNYGKIQYDDSNQSMLITTVGSGFSGYDLNLGTKDNIRLTILGSNGSVGIGTSSPTSKLFVLGTGTYGTPTSEILTSDATIFSSEMSNNAYNSILQLVSVRQSLTTGASSNGFLGFSTIDDSNGEGIRDAGRIAIVNESASSRNSPTALGFWTNSGGTKTTTATEKIRITSAGNVGIGTSSPNNLLSVRGNLDLGTTGISYVGPSQYGGVVFPRGQILFSNTNTQNQFYISSNAYTNASGVFAYRNSGQPALALGLDNGGMAFLTAGNGTADATISWTTAIGVSNNGTVTRPNQPAFLAYSENSGFTVTGGGWYNISNALTVESYDIGSNYSGGRFTAPVAGRYFFYAGGWTNINSNGERYAWSAVVNNTTQTFLTGGNYSLTDTPLAGYSIVYNLNAGDYVDLFVFSAISGTWGQGTHRVFFGGYLL